MDPYLLKLIILFSVTGIFGLIGAHLERQRKKKFAVKHIDANVRSIKEILQDPPKFRPPTVDFSDGQSEGLKNLINALPHPDEVAISNETLDLVFNEKTDIDDVDFTHQLSVPVTEQEESIIRDLLLERQRQDDMWGVQDYPSVVQHADPYRSVTETYGLPSANTAREDVEISREMNYISWAGVATEELCEVVECKNDIERREELVQLGALIIAWIECIDRKTQNG